MENESIREELELEQLAENVELEWSMVDSPGQMEQSRPTRRQCFRCVAYVGK